MSSATSIKGVRLKSGATMDAKSVHPKPETSSEDAGFRPWHFFVLASLMAATVAVVMSRQSSPEHLVLISLTIASAGLAAAGFYRMLVPLAVSDAATFAEPLSERTRATLEREKALVLRSIKELEFDRAMGKLSARDFDEMAGRLRTRAISLIKELDEGEAGYRVLIERELAARVAHLKGVVRERATGQTAPGPEAAEAAETPSAENVDAVEAGRKVCSGCNTDNDLDAAFCKRCGTRL